MEYKTLVGIISSSDLVAVGISGVLAHEFGHLLLGSLQSIYDWNSIPSERQISSLIVSAAFSSLGMITRWDNINSRVELSNRLATTDSFRREISGYANVKDYSNDNDAELVSEAFAYFWYNGRGNIPLVDAIMDDLLRRLR